MLALRITSLSSAIFLRLAVFIYICFACDLIDLIITVCLSSAALFRPSRTKEAERHVSRWQRDWLGHGIRSMWIPKRKWISPHCYWVVFFPPPSWNEWICVYGCDIGSKVGWSQTRSWRWVGLRYVESNRGIHSSQTHIHQPFPSTLQQTQQQIVLRPRKRKSLSYSER